MNRRPSTGDGVVSRQGVPPAGSGHSPKGGAAISVASPAKPSVPNADDLEAWDSYDDRLDDCWNCGGDGFVANCWDGLCINADDGCDLCMERCDYCKPAALSGETPK